MNIDIATIELVNKQVVSLAVIKVINIPDMSTLMIEEVSEEQILEKQNRSFQSLLSEINHIGLKSNEKVSAEIMWLTEPAENQIYLANINLYIVVRCLSGSADASKVQVERITREVITNLRYQRYNVENVSYDILKDQLADVREEKSNAIVKRIRKENLGTNIIDECYSYDIFSDKVIEMEEIAFILTQYPNCVLSVSIVPTDYTKKEIECIDNTTQALFILSNGANTETIKVLSIAKADKLYDTYKYYSDKKAGGVFIYNIIVSGNKEAVDDISAKVIGYLQRENKNVGLRRRELSKDYVSFKNNFFPLPWATTGYVIKNENINSDIVQRLPLLISTDEATDIFRLPIGSKNISAGLSINFADTTIRKYKEDVINKGDLSLGYLKNSVGNQLGISLKDLTRHSLVVGTPGSGKTTLLVGLLNEVYKKYKIPFLVIEPAKNEYRALINELEDLQVFTPGKNFISPFIINPFIPPKNVKLEYYKSVLKTAFSASILMEPPLDQIFYETIDNCYAKFGWLDDYAPGDGGEIFNIDDFIECFEETFKEIGYRGDALNIGQAGIVRLKGLSRLFKNYHSIPVEDIISKPTIIELAAIENEDEKALIIALVLLSILSYVNANVISKGELNNLILLEEAHVLLDSNDNPFNNAGAIAQRLIKRMLAELRSAGVGMIIADQSPSKVTSDVVALTDIKVAFRIVEKKDREIVENSINLDAYKGNRLSRFGPGEAYVFFNKLEVAEEVEFSDYRKDNKIEITLSDEELRQKSVYWKERPAEMKPYPSCKLIKTCSDSCDYHTRLLADNIARKICKKYVIDDKEDAKRIFVILEKIDELIEAELKREENTAKLKGCVRVHFFRKLRYEYGYKLSYSTNKILEKYGGKNAD